MSDDELITAEDLAEMVEYARQVEAQPVREYLRRGPVSGGPKRVDPSTLLEARVDLRAAKLTEEHHDDLREESRLVLFERIEHWLTIGIPVQFIADAVGFKNRSQVYDTVERRLPRIRRHREARRRLLEEE